MLTMTTAPGGNLSLYMLIDLSDGVSYGYSQPVRNRKVFSNNERRFTPLSKVDISEAE
jgi:hypothetical protein